MATIAWGCPLELDKQLRHSLSFAAFRLYCHSWLPQDKPHRFTSRGCVRPPENTLRPSLRATNRASIKLRDYLSKLYIIRH